MSEYFFVQGLHQILDVAVRQVGIAFDHLESFVAKDFCYFQLVGSVHGEV